MLSLQVGISIPSHPHAHTPHTQLCTFGVVVDAGSRDEVPGEEDGVCHLFEAMAFKSTQGMTHQQVVSALDDLGAIPTANSSREQLLLSVDVLRNSLPEAFQIFADIVLHPKIGTLCLVFWLCGVGWECVCLDFVYLCACMWLLVLYSFLAIFLLTSLFRCPSLSPLPTHRRGRSGGVQDDPRPAPGEHGPRAYGQGGNSRSGVSGSSSGETTFCDARDSAQVSVWGEREVDGCSSR